MQNRNRTTSAVRVSICKLISRTFYSHPPLVALFFREPQVVLQCRRTAVEVLGYLIRVDTVPTATQKHATKEHEADRAFDELHFALEIHHCGLHLHFFEYPLNTYTHRKHRLSKSALCCA